MSGAPNFEDDHFDFPEPMPASPSSTMETALELLKSVILSRPFLLALIAFLSYRLWVTTTKSSQPSNVDTKRSSIAMERVSVRKSQRPLPSVAPPVTMAKKN